MNIKVTAETRDRFYRLAEERKLVLGALLDEALTALEKPSRQVRDSGSIADAANTSEL